MISWQAGGANSRKLRSVKAMAGKMGRFGRQETGEENVGGRKYHGAEHATDPMIFAEVSRTHP